MVYKYLDRKSEKPHENDDIIFYTGIKKSSVGDKRGIPIGEPGKPVRKM